MNKTSSEMTQIRMGQFTAGLPYGWPIDMEDEDFTEQDNHVIDFHVVYSTVSNTSVPSGILSAGISRQNTMSVATSSKTFYEVDVTVHLRSLSFKILWVFLF